MTDHASLDNQVWTDPWRRDKNRSWAITLCSNSTIATNTPTSWEFKTKARGLLTRNNYKETETSNILNLDFVAMVYDSCKTKVSEKCMNLMIVCIKWFIAEKSTLSLLPFLITPVDPWCLFDSLNSIVYLTIIPNLKGKKSLVPRQEEKRDGIDGDRESYPSVFHSLTKISKSVPLGYKYLPLWLYPQSDVFVTYLPLKGS